MCSSNLLWSMSLPPSVHVGSRVSTSDPLTNIPIRRDPSRRGTRDSSEGPKGCQGSDVDRTDPAEDVVFHVCSSAHPGPSTGANHPRQASYPEGGPSRSVDPFFFPIRNRLRRGSSFRSSLAPWIGMTESDHAASRFRARQHTCLKRKREGPFRIQKGPPGGARRLVWRSRWSAKEATGPVEGGAAGRLGEEGFVSSSYQRLASSRTNTLEVE